MSVCLSVDAYSGTTGYEAAYELYKRVQIYEGLNNDSLVMAAFGRYGVKTSKKARHTEKIETGASSFSVIINFKHYKCMRFLVEQF